MNNPQAHSAHYFCHLNEYSAHNVQESRGITLRSYKNTNGSQSTYVVKSAKGSGSQTRGGGSQIRLGGGDPVGSDPLNLTPGFSQVSFMFRRPDSLRCHSLLLI